MEVIVSELLIVGFMFVDINIRQVSINMVMCLDNMLVNRWIIKVNGLVNILKNLINGIMGIGIFSYQGILGQKIFF